MLISVQNISAVLKNPARHPRHEARLIRPVEERYERNWSGHI